MDMILIESPYMGLFSWWKRHAPNWVGVVVMWAWCPFFDWGNAAQRGVSVARANHELVDLIEPVVQSLEMGFWGIDFLQGKPATLRVYIENPEGVTVDHCALVSRQLSAVLDVEDPIAGEYLLEVSSPGADRPLFTIEQFEQFVGSDASIRLRIPYEGRRKFKGLLTGVEGNDVVMLADEHEYLFPVSSIDKANIIPNV